MCFFAFAPSKSPSIASPFSISPPFPIPGGAVVIVSSSSMCKSNQKHTAFKYPCAIVSTLSTVSRDLLFCESSKKNSKTFFGFVNTRYDWSFMYVASYELSHRYLLNELMSKPSTSLVYDSTPAQ